MVSLFSSNNISSFNFISFKASSFDAIKSLAPFLSKKSGILNFFFCFIKSIGVSIFCGIIRELFFVLLIVD